MKITKLSLTNFRSFKEKQTIEFAPVTLLFGPNSVGKSTVLMALFYVQQILAKRQCNPQYIDVLGKKFVGGFKNLVHCKDISKPISIEVEFSKMGAIGSSYYKLMDYGIGNLGFNLDSSVVNADYVGVELEIRWSKQENTAYVARLNISLDGELAISLTSDSGLKQPQISFINYTHPLLMTDNIDEWLIEQIDNKQVHTFWVEHVLEHLDIYNPSHRELQKGADNPVEMLESEEGYEFSDNFFVSPLHELLVCSGNEVLTNELLQSPIAFKAQYGCLPVLGSVSDSFSSLDTSEQNEAVNEILSDLAVAPLDNLLKLLNESVCIGPLRHIPDGQYQPNPYPQQEDWYDGKACWDTLSKDQAYVFHVNEWMANPEKLGLGLSIVYRVNEGVYRLVKGETPTGYGDIAALQDALGDNFKFSLSKDNPQDNPDTKQYFVKFEVPDFYTGDEPIEVSIEGESYSLNNDFYVAGDRDKRTTVTLWDINNEVEVNLSDVGVGVSQLLPLVTASALNKNGFIACEQPELHVHPRVQVAIGDLLTQGSEKPSFLIETHSEHIVLRLLRRVRETTEENLPEGFKPVKPDDISVVFLENSPEGAKANRIVVTDDGDFESDWPGGFFEERDEELF